MDYNKQAEKKIRTVLSHDTRRGHISWQKNKYIFHSAFAVHHTSHLFVRRDERWCISIYLSSIFTVSLRAYAFSLALPHDDDDMAIAK